MTVAESDSNISARIAHRICARWKRELDEGTEWASRGVVTVGSPGLFGDDPDVYFPAGSH